MKLREVRESALALPLRSRKKLAQELTASVQGVDDPDFFRDPTTGKSIFASRAIETAWRAEIKRRMDAYDRGEVETIPGEKVMAWLRKRMK